MSGHTRKFDPGRMNYLESAERRLVLDPEKVLEILSIPRGSVVADIGCGPGVFTLPLARIVGNHGHVYALDTEPQMIGRIKERLSEEKIRNVTAMLSEEDSIPLPDSAVDFVLLVTVLHELEGLGTLLETKRVMKDSGSLLVVDWKKKDEPFGPPRIHRLSVKEAALLLSKAGFVSGNPFDVSPSHYGFKAKKL